MNVYAVCTFCILLHVYFVVIFFKSKFPPKFPLQARLPQKMKALAPEILYKQGLGAAIPLEEMAEELA